MVMDSEMIKKIDGVLDRVKEPESLLSIAQLGWVRRVRYDEERKKLSVFTNSLQQTRKCCTIMASLLVSGTIKSLTEELQKEFPDLSIEFV